MRDSVKCRRLMEGKWYRERWGDRYQLSGDQNKKQRFENDRLDIASWFRRRRERASTATTSWWTTRTASIAPSRMRSGPSRSNGGVVIQQRLHQADRTGTCSVWAATSCCVVRPSS